MEKLKHLNQYIIPSIYINVSKDGEFGNSMMLLADVYKSKNDIKERDEDHNADIVFNVREDFDDTLLYTFTGKKNTSVVTTSDLIGGSVYIAIKPISVLVWDLDKKDQVRELRFMKEELVAGFLGDSLIVSDLMQLSILLQNPYSKMDDDKAYFKKISNSFAMKASQTVKL